MNTEPLRDVPIEIINQALIETLQNLEQIAIQESLQDTPTYLTKKVISQEGSRMLKKFRFNPTYHKTTFCPITLEEFENNQELLELPCKHYFSPLSILNWLHNESAECPLCRYKFPHIVISRNTYVRIRWRTREPVRRIPREPVRRIPSENIIRETNPSTSPPVQISPQNNPPEITRAVGQPMSRLTPFIMTMNRRNGSINRWRGTMNQIIQR